MKEDIQAAINEFTPLFDLVTTSDLQGTTEARAIEILRRHQGFAFDPAANVLDVMAVSDEILEGIYNNIADQEGETWKP